MFPVAKFSRVAVVIMVAAGVVGAASAGAAARAKPDLTARKVVTAAKVDQGSKSTVTFEIARNGSTSAPASTAGVFVSKNRTFDAKDVRVATVGIGKLASMSKRAARARITWSAAIGSGTRYVIVCADALKKVSETKEGNNCASSARVKVTAGLSVRFGTFNPTVQEGGDLSAQVLVSGGKLSRDITVKAEVQPAPSVNLSPVGEFFATSFTRVISTGTTGSTIYARAKPDGVTEADERFRLVLKSASAGVLIAEPSFVEFTVLAS